MDDAKHRGFTLVELLITLTVIALLTGVAAPAMARFMENARLYAATDQLSSELEQARNHAITYQQASYFSLQNTAGRWCFGWGTNRDCDCNAPATASGCTTGTGDSTHTHLFRSEDYPGIRLGLRGIDDTHRMLRFSPVRGTATAGTITLSGTHGEQRVIVSPLGRVRRCSVATGRYTRC